MTCIMELGTQAEDFDINAIVDPTDFVENIFNEREVEKLLALIEHNPRGVKVLKMRNGIGMRGELTLEQTGVQFNVTRERLRQIEARALRGIRYKLGAERLRQIEEKTVKGIRGQLGHLGAERLRQIEATALRRIREHKAI